MSTVNGGPGGDENYNLGRSLNKIEYRQCKQCLFCLMCTLCTLSNRRAGINR